MGDLAPIHVAAGINNSEQVNIIKSMLRNGENPNLRTEDCLTPVHIAAMWGCSEALQCLLEAGGNPWIQDSEGFDAFVLAENYGELICLQVLRKFAAKKMQLHHRCHVMETLNEGFLQSLSLDSDVEEHVHTDDEEGLCLLERHFIPSGSESRLSISSSGSHIGQLSDSQLRQQLEELGERPGPISEPTRRVYFHKLAKLLRGQPSPSSLILPKYPPEISHLIDGRLDLRKQMERDQELRAEFNQVKLHSRDGSNIKCCFTYLLLDPRITLNFPENALHLSTPDMLTTFIQAIFYVGKGRNTRPLSHLFETLKTLKDGTTAAALSDKLACIRDIWSAGLGVVSLHCFQNTNSVEAYTREACMIEALGLSNLTNLRSGELYGRAVGWSAAKRRRYGAYLLHCAFNLFLYEGERQIKPIDMKTS